MSKHLTLIRHATSVSNVGLRSVNTELISLTEHGWKDSSAVASSMSEQPDLLAVSRMLRAKQTAEAFIRRWPDTPVETWEDIHEFVFFNLSHETTREERKPLVDAYWGRLNPKERNPQSESFESFWERIESFHERACSNPAASLVAISHGFFISAYSWSFSNGFPRCTPELMKSVHEESIQNPVKNLAIVRFDLTR